MHGHPSCENEVRRSDSLLVLSVEAADVTGRTEQLNVKVTADVLREFYRLADEQDGVLGEVLEHAIAALMREIGGGLLAPL